MLRLATEIIVMVTKRRCFY